MHIKTFLKRKSPYNALNFHFPTLKPRFWILWKSDPNSVFGKLTSYRIESAIAGSYSSFFPSSFIYLFFSFFVCLSLADFDRDKKRSLSCRWDHFLDWMARIPPRLICYAVLSKAGNRFGRWVSGGVHLLVPVSWGECVVYVVVSRLLWWSMCECCAVGARD